MGFWAALEEVFPATRGQRCWFHYADARITPKSGCDIRLLVANAL
jgi:transposase-like protein